MHLRTDRNAHSTTSPASKMGQFHDVYAGIFRTVAGEAETGQC